MVIINKGQIAAINTLLSHLAKKRGFKYEKGEKAELILSYTQGRTDTTTGLYAAEARQLIIDLNKLLDKPQNAGGEQMRRHIIAMAHEMGWEKDDRKINMDLVNEWCAKFGYLNKTHHTLNQYQYAELPALVSQFKKVYQSYLKSI